MATKLILSLKLSLISLTLLSSAMALKLYLPFITEFLISQLPMLWSSMLPWFTRPYVYFLINFIIITIAASSRFQHKVDEHVEVAVPGPVPVPEPVKAHPEFRAGFVVSVPEYEESVVVLKSSVEVYPEVGFKVATNNPVAEFQENASEAYKEEEAKVLEVEKEEDKLGEESGEKSVVWELKEIAERTESMEIPIEISFSTKKPPVSSKFGQRKLAKAHPEGGGKSLKVSKPKRQDTLENTWKMITEGRSMPLARHLKKSDTLETKGHTLNPTPHDEMKKSESFNDRNNVSSSLVRSQGSGKLRKQASPSQDELNRRVEAFINKFNEEMRLQRLESLNRYKKMINHGALKEN